MNKEYKFIILSVVLFVLVNYFTITSYESTSLEEIIFAKKNKKFDPDIEKDKFMKAKFKIYVYRGIIFGVILCFIHQKVFTQAQVYIPMENKSIYFDDTPF